MENMMKRFLDENKEVLWEQDLYDSLYQTALDGSRGIYKSPDGTLFFAEHHRNGFTYNGTNKLRLLSNEVVEKALKTEYTEPWGENVGIKPFTYLAENGYLL